MSKPEDQIRYSDFPMPQTGQAIPIAPGLFWIRMPLPFALDHINLWLLEDEIDGKKGWTVIDTGVSTDETKSAWRTLIADHFNGQPILRVLCTHFHPDHIGLAYWLCNGVDKNQWQAPLWINYAEYASARIWAGNGSIKTANDAPDAVNMANHFDRHGITDPETLEKLRARREHYPSLVPDVPQSFRRIFPNETIRIGRYNWKVIPGYGHSPEHASLFCEDAKILISGDMLLPKISTNMSVWAQEPDADPLKLYLNSLNLFEPLPDDTVVLPSHGKPFGAAPGSTEGGVRTRLQQLREHHDARLQETLEACRNPASAADVMPVLFKRKLDLHQLTFALGETIAHLNHLWHAGKVTRSEDAQGRLKFTAI